MNSWIGVDLDGTLAHYGDWQGLFHVGEPVEAMADRVRQWLEEGWTVKIVTARVSIPDPEQTQARQVIQDWSEKHFGIRLEVTCCKDFGMVELWDDRCVKVEMNTGRVLSKG